jgi:hypothetical protein
MSAPDEQLAILLEDAQPQEPPPTLGPEHEQELAAAIQLRAEYGTMLALPAWKHLDAVFRQIDDDAVKELKSTNDLGVVLRCQAAIRTIALIRDHIEGVFKVAAAAQSHKAQT